MKQEKKIWNCYFQEMVFQENDIINTYYFKKSIIYSWNDIFPNSIN